MALENKLGKSFFGYEEKVVIPDFYKSNEKFKQSFFGKDSEPEQGLGEMPWMELRALAKSKNIENYTKMKRVELEKAINDNS